MADKKYELVKEDKKIFTDGGAIYRIRALKDFGDVKTGDLGGYIEKEDNLSQEGNCWVYDNAQVFGEARVFNNAKIYGTSEISDSAVVCEKAEIGGHTELYHYDYIDGSIKMIDNVTKESPEKNEIKILENEIQKYEEHCSKVVDKLKLQDELPNFQVISQKGLLYEKNSEKNNVSEMKNFIENLKGEEYWDNMNLKDIRDWKELKNDEFVSIVYETKDDKGNVELEEFNDYNDYAKNTVKNALEKEFKNNPDSIETLRKDILDKEANKETLKENYEEIENKKEKTILESNKSFGFSNGF